MPPDHKQLSIHRESPAIWRVTFDHPPVNLVDHRTLQELHDLTAAIEASEELKVVVFDSADPDFFLAHWDIASVAPARPDGTPPPSWIDISLRLAQAPVVTIGLIRGRARGMGSEIPLGFDMRFASLERAIFGQPEVGVGLVPGGGSMERLSQLAGRARALRESRAEQPGGLAIGRFVEGHPPFPRDVYGRPRAAHVSAAVMGWGWGPPTIAPRSSSGRAPFRAFALVLAAHAPHSGISDCPLGIPGRQ